MWLAVCEALSFFGSQNLKNSTKSTRKLLFGAAFFVAGLLCRSFTGAAGGLYGFCGKTRQLVVDWLLNSSQSISQAYANNKRIIASGRITFRGGRGTVKRASGVKDFCKALVSRH